MLIQINIATWMLNRIQFWTKFGKFWMYIQLSLRAQFHRKLGKNKKLFIFTAKSPRIAVKLIITLAGALHSIHITWIYDPKIILF